MTKIKKIKNETEVEELLRLFPKKTMSFSATQTGELLELESNDIDIINFGKGKGLI